ncbi:Gfo/Idh/MocA family protein [Paenibacillus sp. GCM10027626]|uniref:Gfo/Idh/MocA family protein n=1 Tax=Paenibacillus sp. GCM10027626 TaxID=3273411 RepID=UPI00362FA455
MDTMNGNVRIGIVGCGVIAQSHLEAVGEFPWMEAVAAADIREEAVRELAGRFGIGSVYTDANELIDDPQVDGIIFAMPPKGRTDLALKAFAAGKHVLLEKPAAMNAAELSRLIAARGGLVAASCTARLRFLEHARLAADIVASGELGELRVIYSRVLDAAMEAPERLPPLWRLSKSSNGGGIMSNWGSYELDYLLGVTGWTLTPQAVLAQTWTIPGTIGHHVPDGSDAETHAIALIRAKDGQVLQIERGEYMAAHNSKQWQIIGAKGSLALETGADQVKRLILDRLNPEQGVRSETVWEGTEDFHMCRDGLIGDFGEAVARGTNPKTGLEQALLVQRIIDAIYASAKLGRAVDIG